MALTPQQRDFLVHTLGMEPGTGPFDSPDETMPSESGSDDRYVEEEENQVLEALQKLRGVKGAEPLLQSLERSMARSQKSTRAASLKNDYDGVTKAVETLRMLRDTALEAVDNWDVYGRLDDAERDLADLKTHAQSAHIAPEIDSATQDLATARIMVNRAKFRDARRGIDDGTAFCAKGRRYANTYAEIAGIEAAARRLAGSLAGKVSDAEQKVYAAAIADGLQKAATPGRKYDDARRALNKAIDSMRAILANG